MRWYVNDSSLQGQFESSTSFNTLVVRLAALRMRYGVLQKSFYVTRNFANRLVTAEKCVRDSVLEMNKEDRGGILSWLNKAGPFMEDHRLDEQDDYFECLGIDVTDAGLGEAGRQKRASQSSSSYSFNNGQVNFASSVLSVQHGLSERPYGFYEVANVWDIDALETSIRVAEPAPNSWQELIQVAKRRFSYLTIDDSLATNAVLAREPFDAAIRDRSLKIFEILNEYVGHRNADGSESASSREVIENFFVGDAAIFSGESQSNQTAFKAELTFIDPDNYEKRIFGHWHGKIRHRQFRVHFEWPVPASNKTLKVLYLGPKITKR